MFSLEGKSGLVVGVANDQSIAWGCAQAFAAQGARLALTYLNERAQPHVAPLAERIGAPILAPLDVRDPDQETELFERIGRSFGRLDFLLHAIAFCPKDDLHGRVVDSSPEGFGLAMDVSVHSFVRMVRAAEALMPDGGTCLTVSYLGSERVVPHYGLMGPVKAALEASVRYMAAELGEKGISIHALSPGPLKTRAASGIDHFDELLRNAADRAPMHHLVDIEDVGAFAAFLVSDEAKNVTAGLHYIDGGVHAMA